MSQPGYLSTRLNDANTQVARAHLARAAAYDLAPDLPADRTAPILEVGFGTGLLLDHLKEAGYTQLQGIDVDAECVESCQARHAVQLTADPEAFLRSRPGAYRLILLKSVLAHVEPDRVVPFLEALHGALQPGGTVWLETFNGSLPSAPYTHANDFTHRRSYTEYSLAQVLRLARFDTVQVRGGDMGVTGLKGRAFLALRQLYFRWVRLTRGLERGFGNNPTIDAKMLIAVGRRS